MKPLLVLFAFWALTAVAGCSPRRVPLVDEGPSSFPPPGQVRVAAQQIPGDSKKTVGWNWTVIGDRNWSGAISDAHQITLNKSYPLNDAARTGGTNVWACELNARAAVGADGTPVVRWETMVRGTTALERRVAGQVPNPGNAPLDTLVRPVVTATVSVAPPATLTLATIAGAPVILRLNN